MTKQAELISTLQGGWMPVASLLTAMHWKESTLRGAISNLGRKRGLKIERKREEGVTSYRIAPEPLAEVA